MKKHLLNKFILGIGIVFTACMPVSVQDVDISHYPGNTIPLYDPSTVMEYQEDANTYRVKAETSSSINEVADFYKGFLSEALMIKEEQHNNRLTLEGIYSGYSFQVTIVLSSEAEKKANTIIDLELVKMEEQISRDRSERESDIEWQVNVDTDLGCYVNDIQSTSDGGYIVAGFVYTSDEDGNTYSDAYLIKLSDIGDIQWQSDYGGSYDDQIYSIQQISDGSYIAVGFTQSPDIPFGENIGDSGEPDCWVVKFTPEGLIEWSQVLGGTGGDGGYCVKQTQDEGYIIAGTSESSDGDLSENHGNPDGWLLKLSKDGHVEWSKNYGGSEWDQFRDIQIIDDGYITVGYTQSSDGDIGSTKGNSDVWVAKFSDGGDLLWDHTFGGGGADEAQRILKTDDGGFIIAATTESSEGDVVGLHEGESSGSKLSDYWVIKLSENGWLQWGKCLGGTGTDFATDLIKSDDGNYLVVGYTNSSDGDISSWHEGYLETQAPSEDFWLLSLTPSGEIVWDKTVGSSKSEKAGGIALASDASYIVGGASDAFKDGRYDFWIVKIKQ